MTPIRTIVVLHLGLDGKSYICISRLSIILSIDAKSLKCNLETYFMRMSKRQRFVMKVRQWICQGKSELAVSTGNAQKHLVQCTLTVQYLRQVKQTKLPRSCCGQINFKTRWRKAHIIWRDHFYCDIFIGWPRKFDQRTCPWTVWVSIVPQLS